MAALFSPYWKPEPRPESIFTPAPHAYGYYINISHPLINQKYMAWNKLHGVNKYTHAAGDRERFEEEFMQTEYFRKCIEKELEANGQRFFDVKIIEVLERSHISWHK